ncbi:hypothetical protein GGR50DRAFT_697080 [Xylaria sp. CBS 124048]|nr:hypothetical protein GGR50DRAFT_697080 [Xylaria sp. CBS 124048]
MAENKGSSYSSDPALYIYTSLTAGSSHIVTATSRLETILRANRVPFKALDIAVDEKARMLWGRRAGKDAAGRVRKLPGLVQMGMVLGDLVEIEEWNEYAELKEHVTIYYDDFTIPPKSEALTPVAMRPLNQPFPKSGVAPAAPATNKLIAGPAPPPAPPLPTDKDKYKIPLSSPEPVGTAARSTSGAAKSTAPVGSIAEEAAKRAKQVQLDRLREKVHGKKGASSSTTDDKEKENKKPDAVGASPEASPEEKSSVDLATEKMSNLTVVEEPAGKPPSASPQQAAPSKTEGEDEAGKEQSKED